MVHLSKASRTQQLGNNIFSNLGGRTAPNESCSCHCLTHAAEAHETLLKRHQSKADGRCTKAQTVHSKVKCDPVQSLLRCQSDSITSTALGHFKVSRNSHTAGSNWRSTSLQSSLLSGTPSILRVTSPRGTAAANGSMGAGAMMPSHSPWTRVNVGRRESVAL